MSNEEKDLMARIDFYKKRINKRYADLEILRKKMIKMQDDINQLQMSDKETNRFDSWTDIQVLELIRSYLAVSRAEGANDIAQVAENKANSLIDYLHKRTLAKEKQNG